MNFRRRNEKKMLIAAVVHGILIGVGGVFLFFIILNVSNKDDPGNKEVPTSANTANGEKNNGGQNGDQQGQSTTLYARQFGVFSSVDKAKEFMGANPALKTSAIYPIGGKFYVWSIIGVTEEDIKKDAQPESIVKPFRLAVSACDKEGLKKLPALLTENDVAKLNFEGDKNAQLPPEWQSNLSVVSKVSNDIRVMRVQLLAQYLTQNDCVKIEL